MKHLFKPMIALLGLALVSCGGGTSVTSSTSAAATSSVAPASSSVAESVVSSQEAPSVAESSSSEAGVYVFETEYTDLTYISGHGYSNEKPGSSTIVKDTYGAGASNGYFVGYLYEKGNEVEYDLIASEAIENVTLVLRATMEFKDVSLSWQDFEVFVNDDDKSDPIQYRDMNFSNVQNVFDMSGTLRPFSDFTIGKVNLQQGLNKIVFLVNNNTQMEGTMHATAPIMDCIKLKTTSTATISWDTENGFPMEENLDRFN